MVYRVLLPAAKNGLLAAVLLGVGRAIGETMAVLMATGHAVQIPHSLLDPVRTLTATIAAELGEAPVHSDHYRVLFVIGILLFAITFVVNLTADLVVTGVRIASDAGRASTGTIAHPCSRPLRSSAASSSAEFVAKIVFLAMTVAMVAAAAAHPRLPLPGGLAGPVGRTSS